MEAAHEVDGQELDRIATEPYSTLRRLGLGDEELATLRRKGYLEQDDRGQGHAGYWRIRFRVGDRARTVYVGRDVDLVERVRTELQDLQKGRRRSRQLATLASDVRKNLRAAKRQLEPVLKEMGHHYHGNAIRKTRGAHDDASATIRKERNGGSND